MRKVRGLIAKALGAKALGAGAIGAKALGATALGAAGLLLCPALTAEAQLPPHSVSPPASAASDSGAFDVIPGDDIVIACEAVEKRAADSDVRVVLTISAAPGETAPGYAKVLATDEQLLKDAVRVRIPQLPTLQDHTVGLDVYVVGDSTAQHCDGGRMKIS